jgi:hypothetical protein
MSDGHYCFVRDLGPVKGGKGMKHHEVIIDFNRRGIAVLLKRFVAKSRAPEASDLIPYRLNARKAPR